jgi:hypothetical protein
MNKKTVARSIRPYTSLHEVYPALLTYLFFFVRRGVSDPIHNQLTLLVSITKDETQKFSKRHHAK